MRQSQQCALKLPDTGYAVSLDLGDPVSPFGSIHPRRKQEVGRYNGPAIVLGHLCWDTRSAPPHARMCGAFDLVAMPIGCVLVLAIPE